MNPLSEAERDELAGEYVLGTLSAEQHREVERRLANDPALQAAVDAWEARLLPLTAQAAAVEPSMQLWPRIERSLGAAAPARSGWWNSLNLWRGLAGAGLAASLLLASLLAIGPASAPPSYLVVLVAPQDRAPGWVIQARDSRQLQLIPMGTTSVPADKALQFWTKGDDWQAPVSLGLVKPGQVIEIPLDRLPPLQPNQLFELTLEPPSGSPTGKPTGPIQFIGRAVKVI